MKNDLESFVKWAEAYGHYRVVEAYARFQNYILEVEEAKREAQDERTQVSVR